MAGKTLVAAGLNIYINGQLFGAVKSFRWTTNTPAREVRGIDSVEAYDLAPGSAIVQGDVGVWRTRMDGGTQGAGAGFTFTDLPHGTFFSIHMVDVLTQSTVFQADSCWVTSESWGTEAQRTMSGQFTFKGLSWGNEIAR